MQKMYKPIILILFIVGMGFSGIRQTVCPSSCNYTTIQACEDNLTKSYTGVGKDTCDITVAGRYIQSVAINGQSNTDANNYPIFLSSLPLGQVELYNSTTHTVDINNVPFAQVCCLVISQGNSSQYTVRVNSAIGGVVIDRCYIKPIVDAYGVTYTVAPAGSPRAILQNSIVRCSSATSNKSGVYAPIALNNVTIVGFKQGVTEALPTNVAVVTEKSAPQTAFTSLLAGGNYNSSYDNTAPGANSIINTTDIKLKSDSIHIFKTSPLFGIGTTLSNLRDIDNDLFRVPRSIGADEPYDSSDSSSSIRRCGPLRRIGVAPCRR